MDWDKTIDTVGEVSRKTFTVGLCFILLLTTGTGSYIAIMAAGWLIRHARQALGS